MDFEKFWCCFGQFFGLNLRGRFQKFSIFEHICEFKKNRPTDVFCLYWFYVLVLKWGYPLGVATGVKSSYWNYTLGQVGLLFFVRAFGRWLSQISNRKLTISILHSPKVYESACHYVLSIYFT